MKKAFLLTSILFLSSAFAISQNAVKRKVQEDLRNYDLLGTAYMDELTVDRCDEEKCLLTFRYTASGCHWDQCYDLECSGTLSFNLEELLTDVVDQECVDL